VLDRALVENEHARSVALGGRPCCDCALGQVVVEELGFHQETENLARSAGARR
jgi:hypothetical protein